MTYKIHLDFETFSELDIKEVGGFRYAEDPSTEILIAAFSIGDSEIVGVDIYREGFDSPALHRLYEAIQKGYPVCAHNAPFERSIWHKAGRGRFPINPAPTQWNCTAARSRLLAIPGSLDGASKALGIKDLKDDRGKVLINTFSKPQRKKVKGQYETWRIYPEDRPEEYQEFIDYCIQDVAVERSIDEVVPELSRTEARAFRADYDINDRGMPVNLDLVRRSREFVEEYDQTLKDRSVEISGYRPTQREKTLAFLESRGYKLPNLQAATVEELAHKPGLPADIKELLDHRIETSRAGTKKLKSIENTVSPDGRIRGSFLFSAASTRRWSSTGAQLHNLQKPEDGLNPDAIIRILEMDPWALPLVFTRPLSSIAQSIRGFFQAPDGRELDVVDYSSVEPRGLAWMSEEQWLLDAYKQKQDVYRITAGKVYGQDWTTFTKEGPERFMGKQLVLGCGYGMGPPRFIETCLKFGKLLSLDESKEAVYGYRNSVPNIIKFWRDVEKCCIKAVRTGRPIRSGKLQFRPCTLANGFEVLFVDMPSGSICYPKPSVGQEEWNGEWRPKFEFWTPMGSSWIKTDTFGGSITENIIQALTRDILRDGLVAANDAGHYVVGHVHDEGIAESDEGDKEAYEDFKYHLCNSSPWAKGFPIEMEGYKAKRYRK